MSSLPLFDYHIHTVRCKHAKGTMEQYVQAAIDAGLCEMGFSDHLPLPYESPSPWNMLRDELPLYVQDVLALREKYKPFPIRLGVELDYFALYEKDLRGLIASQAFDYVIGSVHYIPPGSLSADPLEPPGLFCIDSPTEFDEWKRHDVDAVYCAYLRQLGALAASGLCQVIGHCDLPKKFGFRPKGDLSPQWRHAAEVFARCGVLCEINTAGLRKPVGEIYPSLEVLGILRQAGVGITLGSDSHAPQEVAADFAKALELARAAGYDAIHRWKAPGRFEAAGL